MCNRSTWSKMTLYSFIKNLFFACCRHFGTFSNITYHLSDKWLLFTFILCCRGQADARAIDLRRELLTILGSTLLLFALGLMLQSWQAVLYIYEIRTHYMGWVSDSQMISHSQHLAATTVVLLKRFSDRKRIFLWTADEAKVSSGLKVMCRRQITCKRSYEINNRVKIFWDACIKVTGLLRCLCSKHN